MEHVCAPAGEPVLFVYFRRNVAVCQFDSYTTYLVVLFNLQLPLLINKNVLEDEICKLQETSVVCLRTGSVFYNLSF